MPSPRPRARPPSPQSRAAVAAARALLEEDGPAGLTMRRLGTRLGIRAQSLYEHFPSKAALETALCVELLREDGDRAHAAAARADDPLIAICETHRAWALRHPHLYRLAWGGPLDRSSPETADAEAHASAALVAAAGDEAVSHTVRAFVHGAICLELEGRRPRGATADALYRLGIEAIRR